MNSPKIELTRTVKSSPDPSGGLFRAATTFTEVSTGAEKSVGHGGSPKGSRLRQAWTCAPTPKKTSVPRGRLRLMSPFPVEALKRPPDGSSSSERLECQFNYGTVNKLDEFVKCPKVRICHFDHREKSFQLKLLALQYFSLRSK